MNKVCYPSLKDKNFLITGATSGIGKGISLDLLKQGSLVIGVGRDGSKIKNELLSNPNFIFVSLDLNKIEEIENVITDCVNSHGKLDGIVNCAGIEETIPLKIYNYDKIKSIFDINVFASVEILRVFSKKKISNNNSSFFCYCIDVSSEAFLVFTNESTCNGNLFTFYTTATASTEN